MDTPRIARRAAAVLVLVLVGSLAVVASPATATEARSEPAIELGANELQQLRSFLDENGVDGPTQEALLTKLERGEPWDSLRPNASPVAEETVLHDRHVTTKAVYADGSIVVTSVSKPNAEGDGDASPSAVKDCSVRSSPPYATYYDNCRADVNLGVIRMGFHFDYERIASVGAEITDYWGRFQHCIGCTLSDHRLERWGGSDTKVRYSAECNIAFRGFPAGWTAWMQANVSMTSAWTTNN